MSRPDHVRWPSVLTALFLLTGLARAAQATETLFFEAEGENASQTELPSFDFVPPEITVTAPLVVKDSADASGGSYIEVESGHKSTAAAPATGQVCHKFKVSTTDTYRLWGRVIAPSTGDDSFWVRINDSTWINWRPALGNSWHWDVVRDVSTPDTPERLTLHANELQQLCIAYREDGAKLDVLALTNDAFFEPDRPITGGAPAPARTRLVRDVDEMLLTWTIVPGATGYRITTSEHRTFNTTLPSLVLPSFGDDYRCFVVNAKNANGVPGSDAKVCASPGFNGFRVEAEMMSLTPPLKHVETIFEGIAVTPGNNSLAEPPSTGSLRWTFKLARAHTLKVWGRLQAPNPDSDSWWVRMDRGRWIKWNNIKPIGPCGWDDVHDSDNGGAAVKFDLAPGSHSLEVAYREEGSVLDRFVLTENLSVLPPADCAGPAGE